MGTKSNEKLNTLRPFRVLWGGNRGDHHSAICRELIVTNRRSARFQRNLVAIPDRLRSLSVIRMLEFAHALAFRQLQVAI